jgi:hypothetical protein
VGQKTANELLGTESHDLLLSLLLVIFPPEVNLTLFHLYQSVVTYGYPVGVSAQIGKYLFGITKRPLSIYYPIMLIKLPEQASERFGLFQVSCLAKEVQFSLLMPLFQQTQKLSPEKSGYHPDR